MQNVWLIHSANPKSRPVGIIVFASVRTYVLFKSSKTKQQKAMFATGVTMGLGLAEWIICHDFSLGNISFFNTSTLFFNVKNFALFAPGCFFYAISYLFVVQVVHETAQ